MSPHFQQQQKKNKIIQTKHPEFLQRTDERIKIYKNPAWYLEKNSKILRKRWRCHQILLTLSTFRPAKKAKRKLESLPLFLKIRPSEPSIHPSSSSVPIAHILVLTLRGASIIASAVTTGTTQQLPALSTEKQHARKIWPPPSVVEEGGRKKEITFGVCVCESVECVLEIIPACYYCVCSGWQHGSTEIQSG